MTAEQASILIPFWQAYKSLSASSSSSQSEIQALYRQIQETLTSEQLASIQQNEFTQETLSALMQQYSVQASQTTRPQTQSSSNLSSSTQSNMVDMGAGAPPSDMGGDMPAGDIGAIVSQTGTTTTTTTTKSAAATSSSVNLNTIFANAVLQVLTQRAQA